MIKENKLLFFVYSLLFPFAANKWNFAISVFHLQQKQNCHFPLVPSVYTYIQGGALNGGLFFGDPPPSLLGAVSGKISEIRLAAA
jgi:hypothetical protein